MAIPRSEYPRPQFVRQDWLCLNGEWEFEIDGGNSGFKRGLLARPLDRKITVPFCPESVLSGIGNIDFLNVVWYRKRVIIPESWAGRDVLLHFQAVDYDATVWINGVQVKQHRGGFTPFSCDLHGVAGVEGGKEIDIVVRALDINGPRQARGKQCEEYLQYACSYVRTTGIWQTVWMEPVPSSALRRPRLTPDVNRGLIRLEQVITRPRPGLQLRVALSDGAGVIVSETAEVGRDFSVALNLAIPENRRRLWCPEDPHLYDIQIELLDQQGEVIDRASSYAGLRSVAISGLTILLNGKPVFQRLVLDQGYYPDGIMTAPTEEDLINDIKLSLAAGFNGARLHQKIFEERFLYHADRLGYLCWGEFANWGCHGPFPHDKVEPNPSYLSEWAEALERDYSHPSIIGWCPLNETGELIKDHLSILDETTHGMFLATKAADRTRPVLDTSGWSHRVRESDIYDSHDYDQNPRTFAERHASLMEGNAYVNPGTERGLLSVPYGGQPYFVSEFGGIWWNSQVKPGEASWGYGERPKTIDEVHERFDGFCAALLDNPSMFGYCYTQLTDVFQEQNGIYHFDRSLKLDMGKIRAAQLRPAAIEKA